MPMALSASGAGGRPITRFRSSRGRLLGWGWLVFAAVNLVDLGLRGGNATTAAYAAGLVAVSVGVWAWLLRPQVLAWPDRLLLRGALRDVTLPWGRVSAIDASHCLRVHAGERTFRSYVVSSGVRAQRRSWKQQGPTGGSASRQDTAATLLGRTEVDYVAEELTRLRERYSRQSPPQEEMRVQTRWAEVAALGLSSLVCLVLVVRVAG